MLVLDAIREGATRRGADIPLQRIWDAQGGTKARCPTFGERGLGSGAGLKSGGIWI